MNAHPRDLTSDRHFMDRISDDDVLKAEQEIIACIFADNDLLSSCGLEDVDFSEPLHQIIFTKALDVYRGHERVNPVSLKPFVPKYMDGLGDKTPAQYLSNIAILGASPSTRSGYEGSLQIVKRMSLARQLLQEAEFTASVAKEGHSLLVMGEEIERLEERLKERRARFSESKSIASPGDQYIAAFQAAARRDGIKGVPINLSEIRRVLSENVFAAGNLYGLLSSSGEGKTALTMQLIYDALLAGNPVLFLSYDQSAYQCVRQMISQVHGISTKQQDEPMRLMSDRERDTCVQFAMWVKAQPLEIIRCQREGVGQLVAYARRFIKKRANGQTPFVAIDHIGKVKPRDPKLDAGRISGEITVELKALADELGASVLILNQRNGEMGKRQNPRPIAKDLYGGEPARSDYDAIITLYRPEKYKKEMEKVAATKQDWAIINSVFGSEIEGIAEIASIKVRFGDPSIVERVHFEGRYTRYVSMEPERERELF